MIQVPAQARAAPRRQGNHERNDDLTDALMCWWSAAAAPGYARRLRHGAAAPRCAWSSTRPRNLRGGNTRHARNFRLMHDQPEWYVPDSYGEDAFFRDLQRVTAGATDEKLARILIRGSATITPWLIENGVRLQDPNDGSMPYSRRTAFFLGGGKAMINALTTTALKLGVTIGYDSEVVALSFGDDSELRSRYSS